MKNQMHNYFKLMNIRIFFIKIVGLIFLILSGALQAQSYPLPACSNDAILREMHMCRYKEDLGDGLKIDFEMRHGIPYDPTIRNVSDKKYIFIGSLSNSEKLRAGAIDMRESSVYFERQSNNANGNLKRENVLIDFKLGGGFNLSKKAKMQSLLIPIDIDCSLKSVTVKYIDGFIGKFGQGAPLNMPIPETLKISNEEMRSKAQGDESLAEVYPLFIKTITAACEGDKLQKAEASTLNTVTPPINTLTAPNITHESKSVVAHTFANRKALVIGNDNYKSIQPLKNSVADATAIAKSLENAGYQVNLQLNLDEKKFKNTLRDFRYQIQGGDEVMFYFAGHGVEIFDRNFLLPTDVSTANADMDKNRDQLMEDSIDLKKFMSELEERKTKFALAVIDACRENPFPVRNGTRSISTKTGLAQTTPATGQMIIFSAGAGQKAIDNLGPSDKSPNGLFTRIFLSEMNKPGIPVDRVLKNIRSEVSKIARSVGANQNPAIYDQSDGDFYFKLN